MKGKFKALASALVLGIAGAASTGQAQATTLVLEGSDASTFHGSQPGGAVYTTQLLAFLREGSSLPVAVFNAAGGSMPSAAAGSIVYLSDLSTLSTSLYSALYIMSPSGCCFQNLSGAAAFGAQIGAFYNGGKGGSVAIQDYQGGDWSFVDPILAAPAAGIVKGYSGLGGPGCTDGEVFNAQGLLKGFTQPPPLGCWEHQAYDMSYFGPKGFLSLVDADPSYFGTGPAGSAFLALGGSLGTVGCTDPAGCGPRGVPAPAPVALLGAGLMGLAAIRRRSAGRA